MSTGESEFVFGRSEDEAEHSTPERVVDSLERVCEVVEGVVESESMILYIFCNSVNFMLGLVNSDLWVGS